MTAEWDDELITMDTSAQSDRAPRWSAHEEAVAQFEAFVHSQKPADKPWQPTDAVPYDFESRKLAEGIHPQLIRDVFQPKRVLDVGCGPGHLVRLLREVGVDAVGCDSNPASQHDGIRPWRFDLTWDEDVMPSHDLVVCREVLEHLAVREIRQAARNLARLSTKYIYITTRFAKHPTHLLSVDGSDDLDPTHITMLTKPFLRTLFVLEGCKSRPDLEARMDHQHKGRCLVFEV